MIFFWYSLTRHENRLEIFSHGVPPPHGKIWQIVPPPFSLQNLWDWYEYLLEAHNVQMLFLLSFTTCPRGKLTRDTLKNVIYSKKGYNLI